MGEVLLIITYLLLLLILGNARKGRLLMSYMDTKVNCIVFARAM